MQRKTGWAGPPLPIAFDQTLRIVRSVRRDIVAVGLCVAVALVIGSALHAARDSAVPLPAAGELLASSVAIRAAPSAHSPLIRVMHQFRRDSQFQIIFAIGARRGTDGRWWYELSLPGRPNGRRGWVRGDLVYLHHVRNRIVVHISRRIIEVRRIADGRLLLLGVVAVGKRGAETPVGRDFYVQGRFVPDDPFYGPFVLETSAYSRLSDWPGGGLAGIHGTDRPDLLGKAVSHGCVRVSNAVARTLERLAPLGTPIDLLT
jgi:L,D-transpeptidase catalytic domain